MKAILYSQHVRIKPLAILVAAALILTPTTEVWSAVKNGNPCKKLGAISKVKETTFKCVKEKGNLIWRTFRSPTQKPTPKLSLTPSVIPSTTPKPTSSPTPQVSPTPKSTQEPNLIELESVTLKSTVFYRLNEGKLERKSDLGIYFKSDSRDKSYFSSIRARAFEEVSKIQRVENHPNVKFIWDLRPEFPATILDYKLRRAKEAAETFNYIFRSPITVRALAATEKDIDYPPVKNLYFGDTYEQLKRVGMLNKKDQLIWITGGGGYWSGGGETLGRFFMGTPSDADPAFYSPEWIQLASHEFFHIVQQYLLFPNVNEGQADFNTKVPNHYREGAANFVGYSLSAENLGWYSDAMDVGLIRVWESKKSWKPTKSESNIVDLLLATESRVDPVAFDAAYPLGAVFYEWIVGTYGFDKFMELGREMGQSQNYSGATTKVFGLSKEDLYRKAAPYILSVFDRTINK